MTQLRTCPDVCNEPVEKYVESSECQLPDNDDSDDDDGNDEGGIVHQAATTITTVTVVVDCFERTKMAYFSNAQRNKLCCNRKTLRKSPHQGSHCCI